MTNASRGLLFCLFSFILLAPVPSLFSISFAQTNNKGEIIIKGKITDDKNEPLHNVTVRLRGSKKSVLSNGEGFYSIAVNDTSSVLMFSMVGHKDVLKRVSGNMVINVTMSASATNLDDVIVIGYGSLKQKELTNAISKIKGGDIQNVPVASPEALIQGRAAGVEVIQNSGQPGSGVTVRIRGNTSINAGNIPLYVIDGVPISSENNSGDNRGNEINPLADLNASDIESIEILKDASAAAIYGSRAANGVVLITTKRGKIGQATFTVNAYHGRQQIGRYLPKMSLGEYIEFQQETRVNSGTTAYSFPTLLNDSVNTDWLREVTRIAPMTNVDASVRGGSANLKYSISGNYYDQDGIVKNTKFKRLSGRVNIDYDASKKFSIGNSLTISRTINNRAVGDDQGNAIIGYSLRKAPTIPIYTRDGAYYLNDPNYGGNPVAYVNEQKYQTRSTRVVGNVYAEYKILPRLKFRALFGADMSFVEDDYFRPSIVELNGNTLGGASTISSTTWINENTLTYNASFNKKSSLTLLGGYSVQENRRRLMQSRVTAYSTNAIPTVNGGSIISSAISDIQQNGLESFFFRGNYSFQSKYLLQASIRYDGSSRFGDDNKYAFFPAVSAGWRISEERFFRNVKLVDELKLRVSAGTNGNQNGISNYSSQGIYSTGANYAGIGGIAQTGLANKGLRWEKTTQVDLGIDLTVLNGRISFTADVYNKKTTDLLLNILLPTSSGYNNILYNVGNTQNRGIEFAVTSKNFVSKSFNWTTSFNISSNSNKILALADGQKEILFSRTSLAPPAYLKVGDPIGAFYGWDFLGVLPRDEDNKTGLTNSGTYVYKGGDAYYRDVNGDNKIDNEDIVKIGSGIPKFYGGMTNRFDYRNFDLTILLQYSYGNDIYNITLQHQRDAYRNINRWRRPGDITDVPRISSTDQAKVSRRFLEDGSYLRVKNVTFGYSVGKKALSKIKLNSLRVYATAQNLLTFTKYTGFDPEVNSVNSSVINIGLDYFTYPQTRSYLVGISVGF